MYWNRNDGPYRPQQTYARQLGSDSSRVNFVASNPQMQFKGDRLRTFANWPNHIKAAKETLADAGLYYQGIQDRTKCFVCDGGLENWEWDDDPYYEHAKLFPRCQFIRSLKGNQYVDTVAEQNPNLPPPKVYIRSNSPSEVTQGHGHDDSHVSSFTFPGPIYLGDVEPRFNTGPIHIESQLPGNGMQVMTGHVENVSETKTRSANFQQNGSSGSSGVEAQQQSEKDQSEIKKRISELKDEERCKICLDHEAESVFGPCGHLCACMDCSRRLTTCPICRKKIENILKVFKA